MTEEGKQDLLDYFKKTPPISRKLSNRDREIFLKMLDEPPEPNEALKNAAKRHNELIAKDE